MPIMQAAHAAMTVAIAIGARVKTPGEGMTGRPVELSLMEQAAQGQDLIPGDQSMTPKWARVSARRKNPTRPRSQRRPSRAARTS